MIDETRKKPSDPAAPQQIQEVPRVKPPETPRPVEQIEIQHTSGEKKWSRGNRAPGPEEKGSDGTSRKAKLGPVIKNLFYDDVYYSSRVGDESSYFELLRRQKSIEGFDASYNLDQGQFKLTLVKVKLQGTAAHGQVDLVDVLGNLLFPGPPEPLPHPSTSPPPRAARLGDLTSHGTPLGPGSGSPDVLIGGLPAWRASVDMHLCAVPGHGSGPTLRGAGDVMINGFAAARAGDYVVEPGAGTNVIVGGCAQVLVGKPAPLPPEIVVAEAVPDELPWVKLEALLEEDLGKFGYDVALDADVDAAQERLRIEALVGSAFSAVELGLKLRLRLRIPNTATYLGIGVSPKMSVGGGLEAAAGFERSTGKGWKLSAGSKAGWGVGAGAKFSIDVAE